MVWGVLILAGLLEVVGAVGLKYTDGFTHMGFTFMVIVALAASFFMLSGVAETLPIGTAYAVWTGIGSAGTALYGMMILSEPRNGLRLASLALVVGGSVGMKAFG